MGTKGRREGLLERTAQFFDLPADVVAGVPRLELVGTGELRMEHHKGILAYGSEMLGVQEIEQHHVPDDGEYYDAVINGMMVLVPYLDDIHTRLGEVLYGIG